MLFCAQRGCPVPPTHTDPLCPVCGHPLHDDGQKAPTPEPTPEPTAAPTTAPTAAPTAAPRARRAS